MSDYPATAESSPFFIHTYTRYMLGAEIRQTGSATVAALTWTANTAIYIPFWLPWAYPVRRLFWINGSTITTTNADIGIYSEGGARIFGQGSTALSGASVVQYVTPSVPFLLLPGRYYLGWNCSGTTARAFGVSHTATQGRALGLLSQAVGAVTLPSPATFATYAGTGLPVCGFTKLASGF